MNHAPPLMATPHPLWLGAILTFGGLLAALDGQWGLALLFFAFSAAVVVGGLLGWRKQRREAQVVAASVPPQR